MRKIYVILLVLCLSGCRQAKADPPDWLNVYLINVLGENSVSKAEALTVFKLAAEAARRDMNVPVYLIGYEETRLEVDLYNLEAQYDRYYAAKVYANSRNVCREPGSVCYFVFPPIQHDGQLLFGGISQTGCLPASMCIGQAGAWSSHNPPKDRLYGSSIVLAHEMVHARNASHKKHQMYGPNIMDPAAGQFVDSHRYTLPYVYQTYMEVTDCLGISRQRDKIRRTEKRCKYLKRIGKTRKLNVCRHRLRTLKGSDKLDQAVYPHVFEVFE